MCAGPDPESNVFYEVLVHFVEAALAELSWFEPGDPVHQQTFALLNLPPNLSAMCVVI